MLGRLIVFLLGGFVASSCVAKQPAKSEHPVASRTYRNPLGVHVADPFVLAHKELYYLYGTSSRSGFKVWTSKDLVNWTEAGRAFRRDVSGWGEEKFWAPCVLEYRGLFYLFYSCLGEVAGGRDSLRICLAKSDSPLGPFRDVMAPLFDIGKAVIDAHAFVDTDGKPYLYYALDHSEQGFSSIYVVRLAKDFMGTVGEPVLCVKPDQPWEQMPWNEAPFVLKDRDDYVMTYSGNGFFDPQYGLGYATAKSPLGPWTKGKENPILARTTRVSGPGHNAIIASPDGSELFTLYHVHRNLTGGGARELAIDRLFIEYRPDGRARVRINGPTTDPQPMPR